MIIIFHGDDIVASRQELKRRLKQLKTEKLEIIKLEAIGLSSDQLAQALQSNSLFGLDRLVVIENLFSQPQISIKTQFIDLLDKGTKSRLILWEKKSITTSNLKKLALYETEIKLFKTPAIIFKFLDSIRPNNQAQILNLYHLALKQNPAEAIFYFLCRRIAQLIQAADPESPSLKAAPWQQTKLNNQAKHKQLEDWLKLHQKLVNIDYQIKTGKNLLPLSSQLDLLLIDL